MLVETDRDKYCVNQIIDFYRAAEHRLRRLLRGRVALQAPRRARQAEGDAGRVAADGKSARSTSRRSGAALEETKEDVGPLAKLQAMWRARAGWRRRPPSGAAGLPSRCATSSCSCARRSSCTSHRARGQGHRRRRAAVPDVAESAVRRRNRIEATTRCGRCKEPKARRRTRVADPRSGSAVPAGQRARYEAAFARFARCSPTPSTSPSAAATFRTTRATRAGISAPASTT